MALTATQRLDAFIERSQNQYDKYENRIDAYADVAFGVNDANMLLTPNQVQALKESSEQQVFVDVLNKGVSTVTEDQAKDCAYSSPDSTSNTLLLDYTRYNFSFTIERFPDDNNNRMREQDLFNNLYTANMNDVMDRVSTQYINELTANANQFFSPQVQGIFGAPVGNVIQVPVADAENFFNKVDSYFGLESFRTNDLYSIAGEGVRPIVNKLYNQGSSNATNQTYQFEANSAQNIGIKTLNKSFLFSNRIVNENQGFIMPMGSTAILSWVDIQYKSMQETSNGTAWELVNPSALAPWGAQDMLVGVRTTEDCAGDAPVEKYHFVVYVSTSATYNSNPATQASPILMYEFV